MPHDPGQRLQKALAHLGLGSRREVEAWIRAGRLTVNGATAALGTRVRESDRIRLDGRLVRQRPAASRQVFVCHRSPGEPLDTAAVRDEAAVPDPAAALPADGEPHREALLDRLPRAGGRRFIAISPMPQHDGGLELVTSDGEVAERLQRAVRGLTGEFSIRLRGQLSDVQLASVCSGALDSGQHLEVLDCAARGGEGANHWYALRVRGASGREVRQLFERAGAIVSRVLRIRLGSVSLDRALSRGRFRRLAPPELHALLGRDEEGEQASPASSRSPVRHSDARRPGRARAGQAKPPRRPSPTARRSSRR